jgi:hypothetical protein
MRLWLKSTRKKIAASNSENPFTILLRNGRERLRIFGKGSVRFLEDEQFAMARATAPWHG